MGDRMQQPSYEASGSTGIPVGMVTSALGRQPMEPGVPSQHVVLPRPSWLKKFPCPGWLGWRTSHVRTQLDRQFLFAQPVQDYKKKIGDVGVDSTADGPGGA